ncbi:cysteine sulfinate desulfinase [Porphyromonas crevioricanis]|uniref:aminotransferase class V-fold PLP-dependent enzyme n=1 Tax=Porphyromonas crevioricanis TaxID=393921 RepID=UPI00052DDEBA|nr:cysteine desulfurase [Porphyromonas crevioricanis]KGN90269.1 cysteine sulfinate desulfinase [Porphyromonas crevioricanis]
MYNVKEIRQQFPLLNRLVSGKPYIYMDNAATTQKPQSVLDAITESYSCYNANIHRGVHYLSRMATERHEQARQRIATYLNAADSSSILFVRGTTEAINLVASSYGKEHFSPGSELILSTAEHHSNIVPWQLAGEQVGLKLRVIPLLEDGSLDLATYEKLFSPQTAMVAIAGISNVLGIVNPVKQMIEIAHRHKVPVLVDAAQMIAHSRVDVQDLDCDFLAFSAHKIYGPNGLGVLYGKKELLETMPPYQGGGEMIAKVSFDKTTYNELPYKFEAGTPDYVGSVALSAALDFVEELGIESIARHEAELSHQIIEGLEQIKGIRFLGTSRERAGVISFLIGDIHHYDMGMLLDQQGVAVRTGHHCAQPLMDYFGLSGTVRVSVGLYNTEEDVQAFLKAIKRTVTMF